MRKIYCRHQLLDHLELALEIGNKPPHTGSGYLLDTHTTLSPSHSHSVTSLVMGELVSLLGDVATMDME